MTGEAPRKAGRRKLACWATSQAAIRLQTTRPNNQTHVAAYSLCLLWRKAVRSRTSGCEILSWVGCGAECLARLNHVLKEWIQSYYAPMAISMLRATKAGFCSAIKSNFTPTVTLSTNYLSSLIALPFSHTYFPLLAPRNRRLLSRPTRGEKWFLPAWRFLSSQSKILQILGKVVGFSLQS